MEEDFEPVFASLLSFVPVSGNCIGSELCSLTSEKERERSPPRPMCVPLCLRVDVYRNRGETEREKKRRESEGNGEARMDRMVNTTAVQLELTRGGGKGK